MKSEFGKILPPLSPDSKSKKSENIKEFRWCHGITGIQQNGVLVKFRKFCRPDCDERDSVFPVAVERRVGEGFSLVFPEKAGITENYVINLVAGTFTIQPVPLFLWLLTFSAKRKVSGSGSFRRRCSMCDIITRDNNENNMFLCITLSCRRIL